MTPFYFIDGPLKGNIQPSDFRPTELTSGEVYHKYTFVKNTEDLLLYTNVASVNPKLKRLEVTEDIPFYIRNDGITSDKHVSNTGKFSHAFHDDITNTVFLYFNNITIQNLQRENISLEEVADTMTPEELKTKASKLDQLEQEIRLLKHEAAYLVIHFDGQRPYIRTGATSLLYLDGHLEDFANFIGETVLTKMLLNREQKIKAICNE